MGNEFRDSGGYVKICRKPTWFLVWSDLWVPKEYLLVFGNWNNAMGGFGGKGLHEPLEMWTERTGSLQKVFYSSAEDETMGLDLEEGRER